MEHNLMFKIIPFLDRHQVLPVIEFLQEKNAYNPMDLERAKLQLVEKTKMVDLAADLHQKVNPDKPIPAEQVDKQRTQVFSDLTAAEAAIGPFLAIMKGGEETENAENLIAEKKFTLPYLAQNYGIKEEHMFALYPFARLYFDCGRYQLAATALDYYRELETDDEDKKFAALWGKLAADILMVDERALDDLKELAALIEERVFTDHLQHLQQRTWLIHWSLFVYFQLPQEDGLSGLIDFLFQEKLLNTIQTNCPHILRYLTVAAVINKDRFTHLLTDTTRILKAERVNYSDPVTEFLLAVYGNFDFELARIKLKECEALIANDFFLTQNDSAITKFLHSARLLVFETYCKIHVRIDMKQLRASLDIKDDHEAAIVEFIRDARVNAKIDCENDLLIIAKDRPSVHKQVSELDKIKDLEKRTRLLFDTVEKKYASKQPM